ncbi:MAG: BTAD domain-containing putative transcriptional regulator [Hyphomicrobiaceae bacterium]
MAKPIENERSDDSDSPRYRLQVLGGLRLMATDGRVIELPTRKSALLLAYLAVPAGSTHARDRLAGLLWPSSGQEQARGSLRHALAALRKVLGPDAIDGPRDQVGLRSGVVAVDLDDVAAIADGCAPPHYPSAGLSGAFLDGVSVDGEALDEWLIFERTRSRGLQQTALQTIVEALLAASRNTEAIEAAERLVALDPLREQSHRVLMQAHLRVGDRSKALSQFRRLEETLRAELGVAPSVQSAALADEIRRGAASLAEGVASQSDRNTAISPRPSGALPTPRITIAVLPFQCSDEDAGLVAFADGFSSDIVAGLSRTPEFSAIAWQSSAQVSGRPIDAVQSSSELGASYALTGSFRLVDRRMRITAQLISAASRTWIWAERYDVDAAEALSTLDSIVAGIMGAVDAGVRRAEREAARAKPISDLDAWSLFHRGMWHVYRFTREDIAAADQLFKAAIEKEPSAAGPHAGLAYASIVKVLWRFTDNLRQALSEGMMQARDALARDENDAHVHTVLGRLLVMSGHVQRGTEHLERAVELNPSHAHAYYGLGHALYVAGKPAEALAPLGTALHLSPKDPLASMFLTMTAFCQLMLDDLAEAEAAARRARNLLSKETWSRLALAATLYIKGDDEGARSAVAEAREIEPRLTMSTFAPLVQHIPSKMRDRVLEALAKAGLPGN